MAERGAHVTGSAGSPDGAPSIFDVLAQENLMSGLRPGLRYLVKYLASQYPNQCRSLYRWYEEIYAGVELIVEGHYLKQYSGSFAEHFYGMKRVSLSTGSSLKSFTERCRSILFLVLVPYLRLKLDRLHERLKANTDTNDSSKSRSDSVKRRLLKAFVSVYPLLSAAVEFWSLALQLGYILSKSRVHSPWLWLAGVRLTNLTPGDLPQVEQLKPAAGLVARLFGVLRRLGSTALVGLSRLFGVALFFIQFLDWWYSNENAPDPRSLVALPVPDPPQAVYPAEKILKTDAGLCPICRNARRNDTVLSVSGYAFCYSCIFKYLESNKCCPVTKLPATKEQLIRIFFEPITL